MSDTHLYPSYIRPCHSLLYKSRIALLSTAKSGAAPSGTHRPAILPNAGGSPPPVQVRKVLRTRAKAKARSGFNRSVRKVVLPDDHCTGRSRAEQRFKKVVHLSSERVFDFSPAHKSRPPHLFSLRWALVLAALLCLGELGAGPLDRLLG